MFVVGPNIMLDRKSADIFAPRVYIRVNGKLEAFRMFVFQGLKTFIVLLFKADHQFTYKFIESFTTFMNLNLPPISHQLDQVLSKVLGKEDPLRIIYFNQLNRALKFSNLINKEVFTPELILSINQMHETFQNDSDCMEQHMNNSFYWLVGIHSQGREIFFIFPPNYTSAKVDTEKKRNLAQYFQNLFV